MIVIGADTHERTHALAAVDDGTGRVRGGREIKGKSDQIDALAVARTVVGDGVERFAAHLDERAMEIRLLSDHRVAGWPRG